MVTLQLDGTKDVISEVLFTWGGVLGVGDGRVARVVAGVVALSAGEGAGSGQRCVALLVHGAGAGPVNGSRYSRHVSAKRSLLCCHHRCDKREITCLSSLSYWSFMWNICVAKYFHRSQILNLSHFETLSWPSPYLAQLRDMTIETILGRKNIVQYPLLLKLLIVGLKTVSPSIHSKDNTARNKEGHWLSFYNVLVSLFNWVIL